MPRGGSIIGRSVTLVPLARPSAPPASPIAVDVLSPTPGLPLTVVPPMVVPPVALLPGGLDTGDSPDPFGASCVLTGLDVTDGGFPAMTGTAERWSTEPPGPCADCPRDRRRRPHAARGCRPRGHPSGYRPPSAGRSSR